MRRAVSIEEKAYGPDHSTLLPFLTGLSTLLQATNHLPESELLQRRTLAIDERVYGPEHASVAIDLNKLASLLYGMNRFSEAEPLYRRMVLIFLAGTARTGQTQPYLAAGIGNYSAVLKKNGHTDAEIASIIDSLKLEANSTTTRPASNPAASSTKQ